MGNCYSADHFAEDHIHTDITCNIEEPKQEYRLGTVSNRLLVGLRLFYWIQTSPSASIIVQLNQQLPQIQHTNIKHLTSIFTYFLIFNT